jgi:ElaB/YqjD/DUF883 family membrane-anchored ribosome-binding protein
MLTNKELIAQLEIKSDLTDLERELVARLAATEDTIINMMDSHEKECERLRHAQSDARENLKYALRDLDDSFKTLARSIADVGDAIIDLDV